MNKEEKEAIEYIKKDKEYYNILMNIKNTKYNMVDVEKLMRDTKTGNYTEYEIAESIVYLVNQIEELKKEIKDITCIPQDNIKYDEDGNELLED